MHGYYVSVVRPNANQVILEQNIEAEVNPNYVRERSAWVLVKDFEQESCFILMMWALAIMSFKANSLLSERKLLEANLISIANGMKILPQDARNFARPLQALSDEERVTLLPRALIAGLHRFQSTQNIQDVSTTVKDVCESEADRMETELAIVRYIAWAIPSIGFLGTVRGIGTALGQAYQAVNGDIVGVTVSLGVAFNSTFIALLISIFLMFLVHQLQLLQERLVFDSENYANDRLIRHMKIDVN